MRPFEPRQNCGFKGCETPAGGDCRGDKTAAATQLLASNAAVTDADLDALLPDEGYETLPPPKQDAQPKG